MVYELIKMSKPGFSVQSEHITEIKRILDLYICSSCMLTENEVKEKSKEFESIDDLEVALYNSLPNSFHAMSVEEQVSELLGTQCGDEFMLNEYKDWDEYDNFGKE